MAASLKLIFFIYLIVINLIGLVIMGVDKRKARKQQFRIPEATLFTVAMIGGSIGSIAGMYIFRHKTKHLTFVIGMPAILIIQVILCLLYYFYSPISIQIM